jgi:hypothetical protein
MKEIFLIGTSHIDIKGPQRINKILEEEKPDIVTVEFPMEDLENAEKLKEYIKKSLLLIKYSARKIPFTPFTQAEIIKFNKDTLIKYFSILNYELFTAKEYCDKNKIQLLCIDSKEYSDKVCGEISKNFKEKTLLHFNRINPRMLELSIKHFQEISDNSYSWKKPEKIPKEDKTMLLERNKHMIKEILKIKNKKIIHISGAAHIFENSPNMYEMLKQINKKVKRIKLIDA